MLSFYLPINGVTTSGVHPPFAWGTSGSSGVLIPTGQESVAVTVKAFDDTIVERLYETLDIKIVSAKNQWDSNIHYAFAKYEPEKESPFSPNYDPNYEPPPGSLLHFKIEDNDTLDLQKVVFQGVRATFQSDPDPITGQTISWVYHSMLNPNVSHWWKGKQLDKNPSVGYVPVAYSSQNQLQAKAFWANTQIDLDIINDLYVYFEVDINGVRQSNTVQLVNSGGTLNMGAALAELAQIFATYLQGKKAIYDPGFTLTWKFYVGADGNTKTRTAGTSTSCLYLMYDTPSTTLYHTVVHTGCAAANGQTTQDGVFNAIWGEFDGKKMYGYTITNGAVVPRKETVIVNGNSEEVDVVLKYYGRDTTGPAGEALAMQKLRAVGTPSPTGGYTDVTYPESTSLARELRKNNNATIKTLLQYGDGNCGVWGDFMKDVLAVQGIASTKIVIQAKNGKELRVDGNLAGQGGIPRESIWIDHVVVEYVHDNDGQNQNVSKIYDPSYGKEYGVKVTALSNFISYVIGIGRIEQPGINGYGAVFVREKDAEVSDFNPL